MEPTTDHEREIARLVDEKARAAHGKLGHTTIPEVSRALGFLMSRLESQFLAKYVEWRIEHPVPEESTPAHQ